MSEAQPGYVPHESSINNPEDFTLALDALTDGHDVNFSSTTNSEGTSKFTIGFESEDSGLFDEAATLLGNSLDTDVESSSDIRTHQSSFTVEGVAISSLIDVFRKNGKEIPESLSKGIRNFTDIEDIMTPNLPAKEAHSKAKAQNAKNSFTGN